MTEPAGFKLLAEALAEVVLDTLQQIQVQENIGLGNVDNTSDVNKPVSTAQATAIAGAVAAAVSTLTSAINLKAPINNAVFTGTTTLAADPGSALHAATKQYVDNTVNALLDAANAEQYKGLIDCSANPNYPAANSGWTYRVSVAGKIGGASGQTVEIGDRLQCIVDGSASGNEATVGANWWIVQGNVAFTSNGLSLVTAANYAAMKTLLAVAMADITDASANGRSLVTAANYATMRTLLAITAADITDASANGRSFITAANYATMKTLLSLVKADVGLGNVDNTTDVGKPVSTAQAAADALALPKAGGTMTGAIAFAVGIGTAWATDYNGASINVAASGSTVIADGSGLVVITDTSVTGQTAMYLLGGSSTATCVLVAGGAAFVAPTTTPAANKYSFGFDGLHYRIYSGYAGGTVTFNVAAIRTRNTT